MKSAKSLQIHSHNIFFGLLSKEYCVYQQFIYTAPHFLNQRLGHCSLRNMSRLVGTGGQSI